MTDQSSTLFIVLLSLFVLSAALFIGKVLQFLLPSREKRRRLGWGGLIVGALGTVASVLLYFNFVYRAGPVVTLNIDAIRVTRTDLDPVDLSLWVYDQKGSVIKKVYTAGKLNPKDNGTSWLPLGDRTYAPIPAAAVSPDGMLSFSIKLNPNILATPPNAHFTAMIDVSEIVNAPEKPVRLIVRSSVGGDYELRLLFNIDDARASPVP